MLATALKTKIPTLYPDFTTPGFRAMLGGMLSRVRIQRPPLRVQGLDKVNGFQTKLSTRNHLKSLLKIVLSSAPETQKLQAWAKAKEPLF